MRDLHILTDIMPSICKVPSRCEMPSRWENIIYLLILWLLFIRCLLYVRWLEIYYDLQIWVSIKVLDMYMGQRPWLWCCNYFWIYYWVEGRVMILVGYPGICKGCVIVYEYIYILYTYLSGMEWRKMQHDAYYSIDWILVMVCIDLVHSWLLYR